MKPLTICISYHFFTQEDFFESKRKRETKGKRGKAAALNDKLEEDMHITLQVGAAQFET